MAEGDEGISLQHELTGTLVTAAGFLPCGGGKQKSLKHPGAAAASGCNLFFFLQRLRAKMPHP
jgi:hypothetical protein